LGLVFSTGKEGGWLNIEHSTLNIEHRREEKEEELNRESRERGRK
jgi:hypothetical protein